MYLTPKYYITNQCNFTLKVFEQDAESLQLAPQQCLPFWPKSQEHSLKIGFEADGSKFTPVFPYNRVHETLLKVDGKVIKWIFSL